MSATSDASTPSAARSAWAGLALGLAAIAAIGAAAAFELWQWRGRELDSARRRAAEQARAAELSVAAVLDRIDATLLDLRRAAGAVSEQAAGGAALANRLALLDLPLTLRIAGSNGELLYDAEDENPAPSLAQHGYFARLRDRVGSGLQIGAPVQSARTGRTLLPLARRIDVAGGGPAGAFGGAVVVGVPVAVFEQSFVDARLAAGRAPTTPAIALVDAADARVIAGAPTSETRLPADFSPAVVLAGERAATRDAPSWFDGKPALVAVRRVSSYPLAVVAAIERGEALAAWRRAAWWYGGAAGALALLAAALLVARTRRVLAQEHRNGATQAALEARASRLAQALEEADMLSRAKSRFIGELSRAVRAPLANAAALQETLRSAELAPRQRTLAEALGRSAQAVLPGVDEVIDFTRIEAGATALAPLPLAPRWVLDDVIDRFAARAAAKGLRLDYEVAAAVPLALRADALRLRQVMASLIDNAIRCTERGAVTVRLSMTDPHAPPAAGAVAARLRCEVIDSGPGIDPESQAQLFEPFVGTEADSGSFERGASFRPGLGLALCKRLLRLMDGAIGVDGRPGVGSTFWFEVDLQPADLSGCDGYAEVAPLVGKAALVLSDERAALLSCWLAAARMQAVVVATDAALRDALHGAAAGGAPRFDVVIVDSSDVQPERLARLSRTERGGTPGEKRGDDGPIPYLLSFAREGDGFDAADADMRLPATANRHMFYAALNRLFQTAFPAAAPHPSSPRTTGAAAVSSSPVAAAAPVRVLIAEDNPTNSAYIVTLLRMLGYTVDVVNDGFKAVAAARQSAYDVFLIDVHMPKMDGVTALATIRSDVEARPHNAHTPAIAVTADALGAARERYLAQGFDDYLPKPFRAEDLRNLIEYWRRSKRAAIDNAYAGGADATTVARPPSSPSRA
jgi:signal transduction histidine kinase/CheY-like chemotaxis protein